MKVLFLTGSRSDWGYIKPVIEICKKKKIKHKLCVTNMLLLDSFGLGVNEIKKEGFKVDEEIFMTLDGHNSYTTAKSIGVFILAFTDLVKNYKPDWVVLAGDRYETLAAAIVCAYTNHPIAHIQAGERSGNIDGQTRHAIGKFAHLHFASNIDAKKRLKNLGEEEFRIKLVGAPQLDDIKKNKNKKDHFHELQSFYNLPPKKKYYLVIFHSVLEEINLVKKHFKVLFNSLKNLREKKIWIMPNNDPGSAFIKQELIINRDNNNLIFENFLRKDYLSILSNCKAIIGNSSSGIIESSSFKIPAINIGRRQNKRFRSKNVIDIKILNNKNILKAIKYSQSKKFLNKLKTVSNPYGDGNSSEKIVNELFKMQNYKDLLTKNMTY
jgi:GDP/UDP-N,N'-diacetylbacillosamine 2-epimerase (hydrolysing)